ncbi:hypothetical protein VTK56DRAFT_394 [Thermocarpiscus australiensis]
MGWFWKSSSSPANAGPSSPSNPPAPSTTPTPSAESRSESAAADPEVAKFWQMIQQEARSDEASQTTSTSTTTSSSPTSTSPTPKSTSSWLLPWTKDKPTTTTTQTPSPSPSASHQADPTNPEPAAPRTRSSKHRTRTPQSLAMSEHLLPTTMSCRDAFDYAWHCHTPGAQWNAVYRYGSVRSCSELWDDFWFCMRTKSYGPELRAEAIRAHYRAKEEAKYGAGKPSSEDVWESRDERVAPGTAFREQFEPPIVDDEQFQREDAERRRKIRERLGYETKTE